MSQSLTSTASQVAIFQIPVRPRATWLPEALRQLDAIEALPIGWDSHGAEKVDPRVIDSAHALLLSLAAANQPIAKPSISPTRSGGVQFEWQFGRRYLEVELTAPGAGQIYFADPDADCVDERELRAGDSLKELLDFVSRVATAAAN